MRYLGNKEILAPRIVNFIKDKGLLDKNLTFFDAFCGTGTVSDFCKKYFNLVINDNLEFASVYSYGRVVAKEASFKDLGFDPFEYLNKNKKTAKGFIYNNYAPNSDRMYFSDYNAGRIDYFRQTIESWFCKNKINIKEYRYLLACLLESVSKVANIAGVYGAFLKKWDPRARKDIVFQKVTSGDDLKQDLNVELYNENISNIIDTVDCDILYLDPPYTKNKYSVQYHLLETIIKYDNPSIRGITGARDMEGVSNAWSNPVEACIELDKTISSTKAKYIFMSYSSDGIMSKDYIMSVFKRYCLAETVDFLEIPYKKYRNYKTGNSDSHFEYLIFGEKRPKEDVVYYCPLNYMGGKATAMDSLKSKINGNKTFVDLFGGGFNVGINAFGYDKYIYNDINYILTDMIKMFKYEDTAKFISFVEKTIKKYKLSKHDKEHYVAYRHLYNTKFRFYDDYCKYLFVLVLYGFQQQFRFNSSHEFNNPVGESGYNESIKEKIISFSRRLKQMNIEFYSLDFMDVNHYIEKGDTVYVDPPYLITLGSYNDGKRGFNGWTRNDEKRLMEYLDTLKNDNKIILSNILEYKKKKNEFLQKWIRVNKPNVDTMTVRGRDEVLLVYAC